jgi:hypothetical protein
MRGTPTRTAVPIGMFDDKAHDTDPWSWASMHRVVLASAAAAAGAVGVMILRSRHR